MTFDISQMRQFGGLTDEDAALLTEMRPMLETPSDSLVNAFYTNLDQYEHLRKLLDAKAGRREKLGQHLKIWLHSLADGKYGDTYKEQRYKIGNRHVEVGLDPKWVIGAMSFCRGQIKPIVEAEYGDAPDKMDRYLALDRVMDLDLTVMLQSYEDRRLDMFLETTGFSKALFESMIESAAHN